MSQPTDTSTRNAGPKDRRAVSVVIVSRGRAKVLARCLRALMQQTHRHFEIIVVADQAGLETVSSLSFGASVHSFLFDEPNISMARNIGIQQAAGDIIAFIDDDSVAEPTWLSRLIAPFSEPDVAAAGGYVRGRNGISFQWRAQSVDTAARQKPLALPFDKPRVFSPGQGRAVKTEGTNCAFRRQELADLGGFDPNYAFYLDETDVNMRLALAGKSTAIVPLAQVHHGYLGSEYRSAIRAPKTLFPIGRSLAIYLRKFANQFDRDQAWRVEQITQKRRLTKMMVGGLIEPRDVKRLLATLRAGYNDGQASPLVAVPPIKPSEREFSPVAFPTKLRGHRIISGRFWQARSLRNQAQTLVNNGFRVSLFLFSPTALFHRVRFTEQGVWEQRGGIFGRSNRAQALVQITSFRRRVKRESKRVAALRALRAPKG